MLALLFMYHIQAFADYLAHTTHKMTFMEVIIIHINDHKLRSELLHSLVNMIGLFVTC